jgi:hypothetical protein
MPAQRTRALLVRARYDGTCDGWRRFVEDSRVPAQLTSDYAIYKEELQDRISAMQVPWRQPECAFAGVYVHSYTKFTCASTHNLQVC